ncbi:hypothetical protein C1Y40_05872 [Mycobacterium talmoniae]|uniref:Uncharacterized protein n=1 Tax=Mycobacterium talmoniae TaxID=1858794 RepID=A0A2S8BBE8_9MYCO|nr:hypothetical protein C1Y40_05872 [Mycobacterium talmoniae]
MIFPMRSDHQLGSVGPGPSSWLPPELLLLLVFTICGAGVVCGVATTAVVATA